VTKRTGRQRNQKKTVPERDKNISEERYHDVNNRYRKELGDEHRIVRDETGKEENYVSKVRNFCLEEITFRWFYF
jgi:hypothetical protein